MNKKYMILIIVAILALLCLVTLKSSLFIVPEGKQVVITRFGKIDKIIDNAGLHVKAPFLDDKYNFLKKIYSWNSSDDEVIPTSTKQFIIVSTTARWKIVDLSAFYKKLRTTEEANRILDQIIESSIKTVVGEYELIETVRSTNEFFKEDQENKNQNSKGIKQVSKGRHMISETITKNSTKKLADYGIELIDIVIKKSNYSRELRNDVLQTMLSEREQMAQDIISAGDGDYETWLGKLQEEKDNILSEAEKIAEETMGEGDAQAAAIYRRAYNLDTDFFIFWKTMESYKKSMKGMDITLTTDMDYFDYLYNQQGR